VIEFGEFVRSLSVFHPEAPQAEKVACIKFFYFVGSCVCMCVCVSKECTKALYLMLQFHFSYMIYGKQALLNEKR
jgi:hypothetical protein